MATLLQNPTSISLSGVTQSTWSTLASGAPNGSSGAIILQSLPANATNFARNVRMTGSTDSFTSDSWAAFSSGVQKIWYVGLNSSAQFDYYTASTAPTEGNMYLLGYFGAEAVFFTNYVALSTLTTNFSTYGTGGHAPNATAAFLTIHGGGDYNAFFRLPNSTDNFSTNNEGGSGARHWIVGLNGSQQFSAKCGNTGRQMYLIGYMTAGIVWNTNGTVRTPGTTGSYQNLSNSGDSGPSGHIFYAYTNSASYAYQLSQQSTTWTAPNAPNAAGYSGQICAGDPAQANIPNAALNIVEQGYFTASGSYSLNLSSGTYTGVYENATLTAFLGAGYTLALAGGTYSFLFNPQPLIAGLPLRPPAKVFDYATLTQAIVAYAHRSDIQVGGYTDYFIQEAQEQIETDIFDANMGNGIRFQEATYGPYAISTVGNLPVPIDWLAPRSFQVADNATGLNPLTFKDATWIYANYPSASNQGLPAFIGRDTFQLCSFVGNIQNTQLVVSSVGMGALSVGAPITDITGLIANNTYITALGTGNGGIGTYVVNNPQIVTTEQMTGGGGVFVFGPYPDQGYFVSGTYYQDAVELTLTTTTNWIVNYAPYLFLAACMMKCAEFLQDDAMLQRWTAIYQQKLKALIEQDRAERWAAATLQIQVG